MPLSSNAPRMFDRLTPREAFAFGIAGVSTAVAVTLGLARLQAASEPDQDWTGKLVAAPPVIVAPAQSMSSASLVVPKSMLSLPPAPPKPIVRIRTSCDSADKLCVVRQNVTALPPKRSVDPLVPAGPPTPVQTVKQEPKNNGSPRSLNPLDHLPDLSGVGRPFSAAGRAVTGWIKWY